jgi:molybdopterin synthase catalytic subunit/molybdopterin converting factor small subunit
MLALAIDYREPRTDNRKLALMQVRVLLFGVLKDLTGRESDSLSLPEGATLADVLRHYETHITLPKDLLASLATAVNQEYAARNTRLKANDEVALLPPVSGGSQGEMSGRKRARIVREAIIPANIVAAIKRPEDGAVAVFEGIVRNHSRGRRTQYLDYEAYEEMAIKRMEALAAQALSQFAVRDVAIVHRLGRLEIGETSVLIAVASGHRAAAFDACRWLIDTLKRTVPIWKKEYFEDGVVWADGEPFPSDIARRAGSPQPGRASK